MIVVKIIGIAFGVALVVVSVSMWLTAIISVGVESGLRRYFDKKD